jgi:hypothetical protein
LLDLQTIHIERVDAFLPFLVSDGFVVMWTVIPIVYKSINIYKAKQMHITEKVYCEKYCTVYK